jgi:hypothetical protein
MPIHPVPSRATTVRYLAAAALLGLVGCEPPIGPGQNAAALAALNTSRACVAALPPFGYFHYPGDRLEFYAAPAGTILMGDDGGWCQIRFRHFWGDRPIQAPLAVTTPPAHGDTLVGSIGVDLRIGYRPAPGFAGEDAFVVHLTAPQPFDIPVRVTVVR